MVGWGAVLVLRVSGGVEEVRALLKGARRVGAKGWVVGVGVGGVFGGCGAGA